MDRGIGYWTGRRSLLDGEQLALVSHQHEFTYQQLHQRTNQLAHALLAQGVRKGDRISTLMLNSHQVFELLFAAAKLGAVLVPINNRLTAPELTYIFNDATPSICFYHQEFTEQQQAISQQVGCSNWINCGSGGDGSGDERYEALLIAMPEHDLNFDITTDDLMLMMYTSGTTGQPKGAMLSHGNIEWNALHVAGRLPLGGDDTILVVAPLFHVGGINVLGTPGLYLGATLVVLPQFDPKQVLETFAERRITTMLGVPTMWQAIIQELEQNPQELPDIRFLLGGGSPCPMTILRYFAEQNIEFMEGYGLTESTALACILDAKDTSRKNGWIGKPVFHLEAIIADELDQQVAPHQAGELLLRGPTIFHGYWNQAEATRQAFRNDWFHTGDLAIMDEEGFIQIVDRKKDMIISGGENIYPAELEQTIYQLDNVDQVAVIGIPHPKWQEVPCAIIVKKAASGLTEDDVEQFCANHLAKFKQPKTIHFVDELPISGSGKILKTELRKMFGGVTVAR